MKKKRQKFFQKTVRKVAVTGAELTIYAIVFHIASI